jgi:RNA polymerase sigma-70 factor (ECF subfamily)
VRIALNEALMKIRSRRFREVSIDDAKDSEDGEETTISQELYDWGPNPEQRYSQEELRGILETAISKLAPRYRIVFHLRDIEGFSSKETAQALHLSLAAVKSRSRRARSKLRDSLDAYFRPMNGKKKVIDASARKRSEFSPTAVLYPVTALEAHKASARY